MLHYMIAYYFHFKFKFNSQSKNMWKILKYFIFILYIILYILDFMKYFISIKKKLCI